MPDRPRMFGTDGVRALANGELTAELALRLATAAAVELPGRRAVPAQGPSRRPLAIVGRDPRPSGDFLEAAVTAGLASAGVDVVRLGVVPTPAVAFLTAARDADFGVVISASHNPMPDNGIKFFGAGGVKLADAVEDAVEARCGRPHESRPTGSAVGRVREDPAAVADYTAHLLATISTPLTGLRVVVDCANGAAAVLAPEVLRRAGADVVAIGTDTRGDAINDGIGSTHLEVLRKAVLDAGADAGIAHDGDADRCLAVDAAGDVVDGDQILGILAVALHEAGRLTGDTVVGTQMSNLGLTLGMQRHGIGLLRTKVGDRYVLEAMRRGGYVLGGEQSGHVVMTGHASTGDGLLTALQLLSRVAATGRSLGELAAVVHRLPQVLVNVGGVDRERAGSDVGVLSAVAAAEDELGDDGRLLLRPSGTEPVVRVMVEAPTQLQAVGVADRVAAVVRARLAV